VKCQLALVLLALRSGSPGGDFLDEGLFVGDPAVESPGRQDAEFGFRQIKPTAVRSGRSHQSLLQLPM
jgi:hypothetical protein